MDRVGAWLNRVTSATRTLPAISGVRPYLVTLLATTPSPFGPELNGRPVEPEGPREIPAIVGLDVAGLAKRIVPFPVAAGRYDKLRAVSDGVVWLEIPLASELSETVIGAAEEQPKSRLLGYDLA
jgi:tricorn protease